MTIREIERKIARCVALDAIKAGYTISVYDGGEIVLEKATTAKAVLEAMFSSDEDVMFFYKDNKRVGWAQFIYGNGGWDVLADYTVNMEHIIENANKLSAEMEQTS